MAAEKTIKITLTIKKFSEEDEKAVQHFVGEHATDDEMGTNIGGYLQRHFDYRLGQMKAKILEANHQTTTEHEITTSSG